MCKTSRVGIDVAKAYTGAFTRVRAVPVFNELDAWKPYKQKETILNLSLYVIDPGGFGLFTNNHCGRCEGAFLKQMKTKPRAHMVKRPRAVKKVSYRDLVEEIWKVHLSDEGEEDRLRKKTILNTSYGMLEKQINKTQKERAVRQLR